jgi:leader peptidase (prepilin peptidase)/N-methyltransferase
MGLGDVKMLAAMGALLGFWSFLALMAAVILGAVVGIALKICGKGSYIRFGPFLAIGAWAVLVDGAFVFEAWLEAARSLGGWLRPR